MWNHINAPLQIKVKSLALDFIWISNYSKRTNAVLKILIFQIIRGAYGNICIGLPLSLVRFSNNLVQNIPVSDPKIWDFGPMCLPYLIDVESKGRDFKIRKPIQIGNKVTNKKLRTKFYYFVCFSEIWFIGKSLERISSKCIKIKLL